MGHQLPPHFPTSTSAHAVPEQSSHAVRVGLSAVALCLAGCATLSSLSPDGFAAVGGVVLDSGVSARPSTRCWVESFGRSSALSPSGNAPNVPANMFVNIPKNPL